jgi:hypothetical protein
MSFEVGFHQRSFAARSWETSNVQGIAFSRDHNLLCYFQKG